MEILSLFTVGARFGLLIGKAWNGDVVAVYGSRALLAVHWKALEGRVCRHKIFRRALWAVLWKALEGRVSRYLW